MSNTMPQPLNSLEHYRDEADQVIQCVTDRVYCALLGPRFSGKTELLQLVKNELEQDVGLICISINLYEVEAFKQSGFFASLMGVVAQRVAEVSGLKLPIPAGDVINSAVFRAFLKSAITQLERNLVLIIDHLEAIPNDLTRALLTSLRAAFMEQQNDEYRLVVVVSGALSLATLTIGESSPFRGVARRVLIGDITLDENEAFIAAKTISDDVRVSSAVRHLVLQFARDDRHLIALICDRCVQTARQRPSHRLTATTVKQVVHKFIQDEAKDYGPLQEAVRLIESDPDLLRCVLLLLKDGTVPKGQLPLPLSPDLDPLYLTGLVRKASEDSYQLRNEIYHQFLAQHFDPGRVGHLLTMAGRWDQAINHLETSISAGNNQYRPDLLAATINSMYASEDVSRAAYYLARGLSAGFGVQEARIWLSPEEGCILRLVGQLGPGVGGILATSQEISITDDRLETRAYREACSLRGQESDQYVKRVIPLLVSERRPVGVVALDDYPDNKKPGQQRERELQLVGYLNQAARALQEVSSRRQRDDRIQNQDVQLDQKTRQLSLLNRISSLVLTITDLERIFHLILTGITANFGLGFNRAWLFLLNEDHTVLDGRIGIGDLSLDDAYRTWERVAQLTFDEYLEHLLANMIDYAAINKPTQELHVPVAEDNDDPFSQSVFRQSIFRWFIAFPAQGLLHAEFQRRFDIQEAMLIPLVAHNECLGIIVVDNKFSPRPLTPTDEEMLTTFANLAAAAILNVRQREEEQRRRELAEILQEISTVIGESLDIKKVSALILEQMARVLPFDTASIQLLNDDHSGLKIIESKGFDEPGGLETIVFPLEDTFPNVQAWRFNKPAHYPDVHNLFPQFADPKYQVTQVRSWLGVPLIVGNHTIGVITLDSFTPDLYTSEHEHLAMIFASQAALAIKNAEAYGAEHEAKDYRDRLIRSSLDGIIAVDNGGYVTVFSEGAEKILGYSRDEVLYGQMRVDKLYGSLEVAREINRRLFTQEKLENYETTVLDKEGQTIPIILSATSLKDKAGGPIGSVGYFKDLRPLRKVETELRMILDTISTVAHARSLDEELNTLAEKIVRGLNVTFCYILLKENNQLLKAEAAFPIPRLNSTALRWKPTLGKRVNLEDIPSMKHLLELSEPLVYRKGDITDGQDIVLHIQKAVELEDILESVLVIPLKTDKEVFGICTLDEVRNWERCPFTEDRIKLANSIASQATVLIDRMRAHEAIQRRAKQLATEVPKEDLDFIARSACEVVGAECAVIYPYYADLRIYDIRNIGSYNLFMPTKPFSTKLRLEPKSMVGVILQKKKKQRLIVDNVESERDRDGEIKIWVEENNFLHREQVKSFVSLGLWVGNEPIGAFFVNFRHLHNFTDDELNTIEIFANQAAVTIQQARLFQRGEKNRKAIQATHEITRLIGNTDTLYPVWKAILDGAVNVTGAEYGRIMLWDEARGRLVPEVYSGFDKREKRQFEDYNYEPCELLNQVMQDKVCRLILDTAEEPLADCCREFCPHIKSLLLAPIPHGTDRKAVGVIVLESSERAAFSADDKGILDKLAAYAVVAVQSAKRYAEIQENALLREGLMKAAQGIAALQEPHIVLQSIADNIKEAMACDIVTLYTYNHETEEIDFPAYISGEPKNHEGLGKLGRVSKESVVRKILDMGHPYFADDSVHDPIMISSEYERQRKFPPFVVREEILSSAGIPVVVCDETLGILFVNYRDFNPFTPQEREAIELFSTLAAIAIRNAKQYAALREARDELLAAGAIAWMGLFGSEWSHTITQKTFSIRNYADGLRDILTEKDPIIQKALDHIDKIAQEIQDVPLVIPTPADSEKGKPLVIDTFLRKTITQLCEPRKDIQLELDLNCTGTPVKTDEVLLKMAVQKLVDNALRHMSAGGVLKAISYLQAEASVCIAIEDNGSGIPEEHKAMYGHQRFPKLEGESGSGMGALLARFILRKYGGDLRLVWSEKGKGTRVEILLPVHGEINS